MEKIDDAFIWSYIFQYLEQTDIINLTLTSSYLNKLKKYITHLQIMPFMNPMCFIFYPNLVSLSSEDIRTKQINYFPQSLISLDCSNSYHLQELADTDDWDHLDYIYCGQFNGLIKLTSLNCSYCESIYDVDVLTNLVRLECRDSKCMYDICSLTNLTYLDCEGCHDIWGIENLIKLTSLHCERCDNIKNIKNLIKLTELDCSKCQYIKGINYLTNLTSLNCSQCIKPINFEKLNGLTKLNCYGYSIVINLSNLTNLTDLDCSCCVEINNLNNLTKLIKLNCYGCPIINCINNLTTLCSLHCDTETALQINHIENMIYLKEVTVNFTTFPTKEWNKRYNNYFMSY